MDLSARSRRLLSIDVLRGFDMFWIIGMDEVVGSLERAAPSNATHWLAQRLSHVPWEGLHFYDLIFPLFVFICGVSLVFSLSRSIERAGKAATLRKLAIRSLVLYLIGTFIYYGGLWHWDHIRWVGVLQRIAIANLGAGALFCLCKGRTRLLILLAILLGYWAVLSYVPVPGGTAGDYAEGPTHNWTNWIDFHYLPGWRFDDTHDPEGILSMFPAIATCMLGVFTGEHLRRQKQPGAKAAIQLIAVGVALAALGWLWASPILGSAHMPVIKKLWTSSYVLVAGGYSMVMLGALSWLLDVRTPAIQSTQRADAAPAPTAHAALDNPTPWPLRPFLWIGGNAILLYMVNHFFSTTHVASILTRFVPFPALQDEASVAHLALAIAVLLATITLAWALHKLRIFVRV